jgi:hypothetical protein
LVFAGLAGRSYRVEASDDFRLWRTLATATELAPGSYGFTDRNGAAVRFYRAVARSVPHD